MAEGIGEAEVMDEICPLKFRGSDRDIMETDPVAPETEFGMSQDALFLTQLVEEREEGF